MEVALGVHETHADERDAKVAGLFAMISGEHTQAAGVYRQRLMQRELGGKVGNALVGQLRRMVGPPGTPSCSCFVELVKGRVVESAEFGIGRSGFEPIRLNQAEHSHRVVRSGSPQRVVETAKDRPGVGMPAPPQVDCQFIEPRNPWRQRSPACVSAHQWVGNANADLRSPAKPRA